jgi:hypothetical protein
VKDRIAKLCVGLAADCDRPEANVQSLMRANVTGQTLPFIGFVTPDLEWVGGAAGYQTAAQMASLLDAVEKSPVLNASPEVVKKLEALAKDAALAVEKAQWGKVLAAHRTAAGLKGRSDVRAKIAESVAKARAWAEEQLAAAVKAAPAAAERPAQRGALQKLAVAFKDEPEAKDAEQGVKALERLGVIESLPAENQAAAREKAAKDFAGTRWAALFAAK